jgi:hypothetical protein
MDKHRLSGPTGVAGFHHESDIITIKGLAIVIASNDSRRGRATSEEDSIAP